MVNQFDTHLKHFVHLDKLQKCRAILCRYEIKEIINAPEICQKNTHVKNSITNCITYINSIDIDIDAGLYIYTSGLFCVMNYIVSYIVRQIYANEI